MLSLDEVKEYLRVDSSDEDTLLTSLMQTAHSLVMDVARLDEEGMKRASPTVHIAEMYAVAYLYEHREEADHKDLTLTLRALLFGIREVKF